MPRPLLRRDFVHLHAAGTGGLLLAPAALDDLTRHVAARLAHALEQSTRPRFAVLIPDEARAVEAITARIVPNDDGTPGAKEAGSDGSSFVSSGHGQPTLTIQALAFRAAERRAGEMKRGTA